MPTIKVVELIGISENSWQEAVENALTDASKTIRNISGIDVLGWKAEVKDGKIVNYKANTRVAFVVERQKGE